MRIAFVIGRFPALSETFILNQITGLIDSGHDVDIYAERPETGQSFHPDIEKYQLLGRTQYLHRVPNNHGQRILRGSRFFLSGLVQNPLRIVQSLNVFRYGRQASSLRLLFAITPLINMRISYDIIHCHFGPYGIRGMFFRDVQAIDGKLVTTFHGADIAEATHTYGIDMYDRLFSSGDLFLPISDKWREELVRLGCQEDKIVVHHMGIDCKQFSFRSRQPNDSNIVRFISVCRLVEKKGIEYAIRALAKLASTMSNFEYDVIGDGPLRKDIEKLASELGIGSKVRIHGWMDKNSVIAMLNKAHVLLAPSITAENNDQEGIPVALMEAMAMGLPVVSTQHSGIPELVKDQESGFLVPERDIDALEGKLAKLISDPHIWMKMGAAGRREVEADFNIAKLNNRLITLFGRILN